MKQRLLLLLALVAFAMITSGISRADLLGPNQAAPNNCTTDDSKDTCFGMTFLLTYDPAKTAVNGLVSTYDVLFTINTANTTLPGYWVNAVAIKIASSTSASSSLKSTTAPGTWTFQTGGLDSSGCNGAGSGFVCAEDGTSAVLNGSSYTWEFLYATDKPLLTGSLDASIKALYDNSAGKNSITSERITLQTPEPASLVLLGSGLLGLALRRRRCGLGMSTRRRGAYSGREA